ncbi:MAG: hypothetical protein WCR27_05355 [Eubacteriales bacterium]
MCIKNKKEVDMDKVSVLKQVLSQEYLKQLRVSKCFLADKNGRRVLNPNAIPADLRRKLRVIEDMYGWRGFNIFAEEGYKVVFNGSCQAMAEELEENAKKYLRKDWKYIVKTVLAFDCWTCVELKEFPGVQFNSAAFDNAEKEARDIGELIEEYGSDFESDMEKVTKIVEESENRPVPSDVEILTQIYKSIKKNGLEPSTDFFSIIENFIDEEIGDPLFKAGDSVDDGSRMIEVLCVSDPEDTNCPQYFCKMVEHDNKSVWYKQLIQKEMAILRLGDIKLKFKGLSKEEKLIKKIIGANGGIINKNHITALLPEQLLKVVSPPMYSVGQIFEKEGRKSEIICVSPTLDVEGEWIYFCKNPAGKGASYEWVFESEFEKCEYKKCEYEK